MVAVLTIALAKRRRKPDAARVPKTVPDVRAMPPGTNTEY
jgi:hypothetical protein